MAASSAERLLHQRLLTRDNAALGEAYDLFGSVIFGIALRVTTDRDAAQDVTQETLLDLWRQPQRFDPDRGQFGSWLAAVAHNRSVTWIRREESLRGRSRRNAQLRLEEVPDVGDDVEAAMTAERVRTALDGLPDAERTPIRLAYFGGRSYRQVAEDLHIPEGTIKSRIRAGLRRLSRTMTAELQLGDVTRLAPVPGT
jgi:RNA polymerase sigma factor (sigma-70 family)